MSPPLPPKPEIGPLIRRALFAAAVGGVGCSKDKEPEPVRIGPHPAFEGDRDEPIEPVGVTETADAAPIDAAPIDAAPQKRKKKRRKRPIKQPAIEKPPPIRIGPPRIGPPMRDPDLKKPSFMLRGAAVTPSGSPVANTSLRIKLASGTRIVTTDLDGRFVLDGLLPGQHAVVVSASGYAPVEVNMGARKVRVTLASK